MKKSIYTYVESYKNNFLLFNVFSLNCVILDKDEYKRYNSLKCSEEEKKEFETALERLRIEETLMEMKYELGESLYNFKLQQQRIEEKYQKENLEQERLNLITQKGINQESLNEVFQKQLQLAYRLGMKDIPNDISKTYREEEIQHCEEVLGLKIERKKE